MGPDGIDPRDLHQLVIENTSDLILVMDQDGLIVFVSPSLETLLGYTADELVGTDPFEIAHPDDVPAARRSIEAALAAGPPTPAEVRAQARDGHWVTLEGMAVALENGHEGPPLILVTARDATERKRTEEALRAAEEKYRSLVEQLPLITYMDALDEPISNMYTSPQIEALLGYTTADWMADDELFVKALHPDDVERVLEEHARTKATGAPLHTEYRLISRTGEVRWFQDDASIVRHGTADQPVLRGYLMDVTERKRVEEALVQSEERFRTVFESSPIAIAVSGEDGRLVAGNRALAEMVGYTREELVGMSYADVAPPADAKAQRAQFELLLSGAVDHYQAERRFLHKNGQLLLGRVSVSLIERGEGQPRRVLAMVEDITRQRRLEEQLSQSQRMEAVGRLAGGVAHDFNNLLTGIIGYAELLQTGLAEEDPLRADAAEIHKAADRAASLTRQLLAFSRSQVLQPRVFDLNEVVSEMHRMLRRLIGEDIELVTKMDPALGPVEADPGQIEQVLANLVVNARDAMPAGGRLVIETANTEVDELSDCREAEMPLGTYVVLSVTDTGLGMDAETQARVFEPFFTTKELGKGTGLGLATVYGVVKQSGGFIWLKSEPGAGTTFEVYLPRVKKEVRAPTAEVAHPVDRGGSETVLVVEDEDLVLDLIARELDRRGYSVLSARNGTEALELAAGYEGTIDLLVTDVVMPHIGGPELAGRLTAERPQLKVIYMSGYADRAIVSEVAQRPLLQKPFQARALAEKIREVLDVPSAA